MKALVILAVLALVGCTTTASIDTVIQKNLPAICNAANVAHAAFVATSASGKISAKTIRREEAAYASLQPLCVDPSNATSASVLVAAASAYATITVALRDAQE